MSLREVVVNSCLDTDFKRKWSHSRERAQKPSCLLEAMMPYSSAEQLVCGPLQLPFPHRLTIPAQSISPECFQKAFYRLSEIGRRGKTEVFPFTDYSEAACEVAVLAEPVRMPPHPTQRVLARWPETSIRHQRKRVTLDLASQLASFLRSSENLSREDTTREEVTVERGSPPLALEPASGSTLYWPAVLTGLHGVLSGRWFQPDAGGFQWLQREEWAVVERAALDAPLRVEADVLFDLDEVTAAHHLRLSPNPSALDEGGDALSWFPDVMSAWNYAVELRHTSPPLGDLRRASWLGTGPVALQDMLAGPVCQSKRLALLRPTVELLCQCRKEAIGRVRALWEQLQKVKGLQRGALRDAASRISRMESSFQPSDALPRPLHASQDDSSLVSHRIPQLQSSVVASIPVTFVAVRPFGGSLLHTSLVRSATPGNQDSERRMASDTPVPSPSTQRPSAVSVEASRTPAPEGLVLTHPHEELGCDVASRGPASVSPSPRNPQSKRKAAPEPDSPCPPSSPVAADRCSPVLRHITRRMPVESRGKHTAGEHSSLLSAESRGSSCCSHVSSHSCESEVANLGFGRDSPVFKNKYTRPISSSKATQSSTNKSGWAPRGTSPAARSGIPRSKSQ